MDGRLIETLRHEERAILEELRASTGFRRLEALRQALALYDAPPTAGTMFDALMPADPLSAPGSQPSVIALPGPREDVA